MKKIIAFLLLLSSLVSAEQNQRFGVYDRFVIESFMFSSENLLNAGYYREDNSEVRFDTHYLPLYYQLPRFNERYRFYLQGNLGWSRYKNSEIAGDHKDFLIVGAKAGGGVTMDLSQELQMGISAAYLYAYGKDKSPHIANSTLKDHLYELSTYLKYQPTIDGYNPYFILEGKQQKGKLHTSGASYASWITKFSAGLFLPHTFKVAKVTIRPEFYLAEIFMRGDIKSLLGEERLDIIGTKLHIGNPLHLPWIKDSNIECNYVHATRMHGVNFAFGVDF